MIPSNYELISFENSIQTLDCLVMVNSASKTNIMEMIGIHEFFNNPNQFR